MDENKKTPEEKMEVYAKMFSDYAEVSDYYMKKENPEAFELRSTPDPNFGNLKLFFYNFDCRIQYKHQNLNRKTSAEDDERN